VLAAIQVNVAFRFFLNLALTDTLPHPSLLTVFRARLGATRYQQIFDGVVAQARASELAFAMRAIGGVVATLIVDYQHRIDTDMTTANTITVRTNITNPELLREGRPLASACVKAAKREALRHADASGRLGKQF